MSWLLFMDESGHSHKELPYDTKSSLLLDFRRGAQRVSPIRRHRLCALACSLVPMGMGGEQVERTGRLTTPISANVDFWGRATI